MLTDKSEDSKEAYDKLYVENVVLQSKIKNLETKLLSKVTTEKNASNDTSTQLFLPSELTQEWDNLAKVMIVENFIDFFDYPFSLFELINYLLKLINEELEETIERKCEQILKVFDVQNNDKNFKYFFNITSTVLLDKYEQIFETEKFNKSFYKSIFEKYYDYYAEKFGNFKKKEFNEILSYSSFKFMVLKIKKMFLFFLLKQRNVEFSFDLTPEVKNFESTEILSVNGCGSARAKRERAPYIILIYPPKLHNNKFFHNLKPIALEIDQKYEMKKEKIIINLTNKKPYNSITEQGEEEKIDKRKNNRINNSVRRHLYSKKMTEIKVSNRSRIDSNPRKNDTKVRVIQKQRKTSKDLQILGIKLIQMSKRPEFSSIKLQKHLIESGKEKEVILTERLSNGRRNKSKR